MIGTIYQFGIEASEPFTAAYTAVNIREVPEINARWPDPLVRENLADWRGLWYVWKHCKHDWVGFTTSNQLKKKKCSKIFQPGEIERVLEDYEMVVLHWLNWADHGITVRTQALACLNGSAVGPAAELIGLDLTDASAGAYCNHFITRWNLFDEYMQWSSPFIDRMIANLDHPVFRKETGHVSPCCCLMERLFTIWLNTKQPVTYSYQGGV